MSDEHPIFDQAALEAWAKEQQAKSASGATQPTVGQTPPSQPTVELPPEVTPEPQAAAAEEMPEEWPVKAYSGPQPWQVNRPPAITHDRRILISGSAGDDVLELAACLGRVGYETSISRGENALAVFGGAERAAVEAFKRDYGIEEDPAIIAAATADAVGPWTWQALFCLVNRLESGE